MKVLVIQGSYRKNGNTAHITEMITSHMTRLAAEKGAEFEVETIHLGHQEIGLCRGCRVCFDRGEEYCPLKDELLTIKEQVSRANAVIAACPVYVDGVNGITKNWIDRMAHVCHRPEFAGKLVYIIATTGSSPCYSTLNTVSGAFLTWGFRLSGREGFIAGAKMDLEEMWVKYDRRAERIACRLLNDLLADKGSRATFLSLMMFRIIQRARGKMAGSLDERYWREKGWLQPETHFYIPHHSNPLTVFFARLTGEMLGRIMS